MSHTNCAQDCQTSSGCGNVTFEGCCDGETLKYCENNQLKTGSCSSNPECGWDSQNQYYNCQTDGGEDPSGNNPKNCGTTTQPVCGNGECESGETESGCPSDCKAQAVCGNGVCDSGENCSTCPQDCKDCPSETDDGTNTDAGANTDTVSNPEIEQDSGIKTDDTNDSDEGKMRSGCMMGQKHGQHYSSIAILLFSLLCFLWVEQRKSVTD
jgi:hypothetical protein